MVSGSLTRQVLLTFGVFDMLAYLREDQDEVATCIVAGGVGDVDLVQDLPLQSVGSIRTSGYLDEPYRRSERLDLEVESSLGKFCTNLPEGEV